MCDIDGDPHPGEVEAVTQPDQGQRDDVMQDQLPKVLPGFLQLQQQHDGLLGPVAGLEEIVRLEDALGLFVREALEHGRRVEIPQRLPRHDVHAEGPEHGKIHGRVDLLHEAGLLGSSPNPAPHRPRPDHPLHEKFAREAENDGVEGDEGDVIPAFAVHDRASFGLGWVRVGEEDGLRERISFGRVHGIAAENDQDDDEGVEPCVPQGDLFPSS